MDFLGVEIQRLVLKTNVIKLFYNFTVYDSLILITNHLHAITKLLVDISHENNHFVAEGNVELIVLTPNCRNCNQSNIVDVHLRLYEMKLISE